MSNIVDRVAAAFEALQGQIAELETENARLRSENDGLKNSAQILESMRTAPPYRVQLDEHRHIERGSSGWYMRDKSVLILLDQQTAEIITACLGCKS